MGAFNPRQRSQIYAEISAQILALAPITSTELGEVSDNLAFAVSDQDYELYVQMQNALALLNLNNITGSDLDTYGAQFPNLEPRYQNTTATTNETVTDPTFEVIQNEFSASVASGLTTIPVASTTGFPASGYLLLGSPGSSNYEKWQYTSKTGTTFVTTGSATQYSHAEFELVTLSTGGDRIFNGPYLVQTVASSSSASSQYQSTNSPAFTILDGYNTASMPVQCTQAGTSGNTTPNTITAWSGLAPLSLDGQTPLDITNGASVANGNAQESDPAFRARIRTEIQSLSSGNIDAIITAGTSANFNGTIVEFIQVIEPVAPQTDGNYGPAICYIDDGSGTTYQEYSGATVAYAIPIVLSSLGGEFQFYVPTAYRPIPYTQSEAAAYVFSKISLYLNAAVGYGNASAGSNQLTNLSPTSSLSNGLSIVGPGIPGGTTITGISGTTVTMSANATSNQTGASFMFGGTLMIQGTPTTQPMANPALLYQIQPDRCIIQLNTPLSANQSVVIGQIYTVGGLTQQVNYQIYGVRENRAQYPGQAALGTWIQSIGAQVQAILVTAIITPDGSQTLADIKIAITSNLMNYINSLGIAGTVSYNKVVALCFVSGVSDVQVLLNNSTGNIIVGNGQEPQIVSTGITVEEISVLT